MVRACVEGVLEGGFLFSSVQQQANAPKYDDTHRPVLRTGLGLPSW